MRILVMVSLLCFCAAGFAESRPNVVVILVDDLGAHDLSCAGSTYYETPNIDQLAAGGTRFTQAYAAAAVCSPTRTAMMTGRWPVRVGITDWIRPTWQRDDKTPDTLKNPPEYVHWEKRPLETPANVHNLPLAEITLGEIFKEAGYSTCYIGKWHLGDEGFFPENQGFDYNFGGCGFGQPPSYFDPYTNERSGPIPSIKPRKEGEYLTDREGDEARQFIQNHKADPFLLYYAPYAVHTPLQAKAELIAKYKAKIGKAQGKAEYAAMIESMDAAVGKIMNTLKEEGLDKNTLIVFTSDNGGLRFTTNNTPLRSGKGYPYEGGIRVPAIVSWPGHVPANVTDDTPIISVDYLPTLCAAANVAKPDNVALDGENLWEHITNGASVDRDALYWHYPHYRDDIVPFSIVRKGDWKLIRYYDEKPWELYNLKDDPAEKLNLAEQEKAKVEELGKDLGGYFAETGAKLPKGFTQSREAAKGK